MSQEMKTLQLENVQLKKRMLEMQSTQMQMEWERLSKLEQDLQAELVPSAAQTELRAVEKPEQAELPKTVRPVYDIIDAAS